MRAKMIEEKPINKNIYFKSPLCYLIFFICSFMKENGKMKSKCKAK